MTDPKPDADRTNMLTVTCTIEVPDEAPSMQIAVSDVATFGADPFLVALRARWTRHDGDVVEVDWEELAKLDLLENETPLRELLQWAARALLQADVARDGGRLVARVGQWVAEVDSAVAPQLLVTGPGLTLDMGWVGGKIEDPRRILPDEVRRDLELVLRAKRQALIEGHDLEPVVREIEDVMRELGPADRGYRTRLLSMVSRATSPVEWAAEDPHDGVCGYLCTPDGCHESHATGTVQLHGPATHTEYGSEMSDMSQRFRPSDGELLAESGRAVLRMEARIRQLEAFIDQMRARWKLDNSDLDDLLRRAAAGLRRRRVREQSDGQVAETEHERAGVASELARRTLEDVRPHDYATLVRVLRNNGCDLARLRDAIDDVLGSGDAMPRLDVEDS